MSIREKNVEVKPETRNHKGFFVLEETYKLVDIDQNGWALICLDDHLCHFVDPDDLKSSLQEDTHHSQ